MRHYGVTMKYLISMPDETEDVLTREFTKDWSRGVDEVFTELISEVQNRHVEEIASRTGVSTQSWVYLDAAGEFWLEGWYSTDALPSDFGITAEETLYKLVTQETSKVRCLITGIECKFDTWIWEGM